MKHAYMPPEAEIIVFIAEESITLSSTFVPVDGGGSGGVDGNLIPPVW